MLDPKLFHEKKLVFKNLDSPDSLVVSDLEGVKHSTDDIFIREALRGANTIDSQIERLDRLIDSKDAKVLRAGVLATLGLSGAYLGAGMVKGAPVMGSASAAGLTAASALTKGAVIGGASGIPVATGSMSSSALNLVNAVVSELNTAPSSVASFGSSTVSTGAVAGSSFSTLGAVIGGAAPVAAGYLLYKGAKWAIDRERHDEGLNPVITSMEAGISLKHDTIEKAGAWNALKKFIGAESKISIETYARIVEHEIIVDKLIEKREELHAKKLAEMEKARKIRRGWATRAKGWITDKFETNRELKQYNKTRKVLERERDRVFKRKENIETQINKTKNRFEEKNRENRIQLVSGIKHLQALMGTELFNMEEWEVQLGLNSESLPESFEFDGAEYADLDSFISSYPRFITPQRAMLRSVLKEIRRVVKKIKNFESKFGAKDMNKFSQRYVSEYVLEKRDVAYKIDSLAKNLGHDVAITKVPAELIAKFPKMTAPLTGVVKAGKNGFMELSMKNNRMEAFTIRIPSMHNIRNEKEFWVSTDLPGGNSLTEKFPMALFNEMGIKIEGINLDSPLEEYKKELLSIVDNLDDREYKTVKININSSLRTILSRNFKFSQKDIKNMGKFKVSGLSQKGTPGTPGTPGKIVLECLPGGPSNPGVILEFPLSPDNKIVKSEKIKVKKFVPGRSISSTKMETEISFEDFFVKNDVPRIETDKKYADFLVLRDYLLDNTNNGKKIKPQNVPNEVAAEYFYTNNAVYNYGTLGNFQITNSGKISLKSTEFEVETIPADVKANTEITVKLLTATATATAAPAAPAASAASATEVKIKAIDLVDFELQHI
ncbi:MAG: hypothetical protein RBS56_00690 [Candidatus Gracilibacteria bacterium]|jgi:hypothetical protein|nr:hypothetical protein [Candidatus Gracilibacteria bacterium]